MIRRILIALDGSPSSKAAAAAALRLASQYQASVHALGIVDTAWIRRPQPVPAGAMSYKHSMDLHLLQDARQRTEIVLDEFEQLAAQAQVARTALLVEGEPRAQIESAATDFDMIVVGRTSLHSPEGEISSLPICVEHLLRNSVRPLLLVPDRESSAEPGELAPVLVAYDGSNVSSRALHLFVLLGLGSGRDVHVLTQDDRSQASAQLLAERARSLLVAHGLPRVRTIGLGNAQAGKPAETILGTAKAVNAELIVMGAYGHRGIQEVFGSCTRSVLANLDTPVLMYH